VPVQRPHDADPREHRRSILLDHHHQRRDGGLPLRRIVLRLGKPGDVMGCVAQRDQRSPLRQRDGFGKLTGPGWASCYHALVLQWRPGHASPNPFAVIDDLAPIRARIDPAHATAFRAAKVGTDTPRHSCHSAANWSDSPGYQRRVGRGCHQICRGRVRGQDCQGESQILWRQDGSTPITGPLKISASGPLKRFRRPMKPNRLAAVLR
jgi:hypothetical protein